MMERDTGKASPCRYNSTRVNRQTCLRYDKGKLSKVPHPPRQITHPASQNTLFSSYFLFRLSNLRTSALDSVAAWRQPVAANLHDSHYHNRRVIPHAHPASENPHTKIAIARTPKVEPTNHSSMLTHTRNTREMAKGGVKKM